MAKITTFEAFGGAVEIDYYAREVMRVGLRWDRLRSTAPGSLEDEGSWARLIAAVALQPLSYVKSVRIVDKASEDGAAFIGWWNGVKAAFGKEDWAAIWESVAEYEIEDLNVLYLGWSQTRLDVMPAPEEVAVADGDEGFLADDANSS